MKKILLFMVILHSASYSRSQVIAKDSLALVALFNSTNGGNWFESNHWLDSFFVVNNWYGVEVQDGRVVRLDLSCNNLNGGIPKEIGDLDSLKYLNVLTNALVSLPHTIGQLTKLDTLNFSYTAIDSIPVETMNLHNLTYLNFSNTPITYLPEEIGALTHLQYLLGYDADLHNFPASIGNLTELKQIDFALNQLTNLPIVIGNCTELTSLVLNANKIQSIPTTIGNLTKLEELVLGGNEFGALPEQVFDLTNLKVLNFAHDHIQTVSQSIGKLTKLEDLQFFENEITTLPDEMGNLQSLTYFNAYANNFNSLPLTLLDLHNLQTLFLFENALTFEDIEPLVSIQGFEYYMQDSIGMNIDTVGRLNSDFTLKCITRGSHNKYQWLKNGDTIAGATQYYIEFANLLPKDSGSYRCIVTNTVATSLTLYGRPVRLHVVDASGTSDEQPNNQDDVVVYPNPAKSEVYVQNSANMNKSFSEIILTDEDGRVVIKKMIGNSKTTEIDIRDIKPGNYFIHVEGNAKKGNYHFKKLVVL